MWKSVRNFFINKYFISLLAVLTWVLFFDKDDVLSQLELRKKLHQLQEEKNYYSSEITGCKEEINDLKTNPANLEKFAREKYLMKKDNEEIFVIVKDSIKGTKPFNSVSAP